MPLQRYVGSHVSAHHQPLSPSFVRTATHTARPAFRTLKGAPLAGPAYPRELPLLAKQTTRPPPPCLSSPAMTPAVAWLAWATRETRYRPTAHEHKHQSLADTPPRAPIVGLAPVKYSCPFQHFLRTRCCFCYVTSSLLAPQPLLQHIYHHLFLHPTGYPRRDRTPSYLTLGCLQTINQRALLITRPAWSLSDPLSFRLTRLYAFSPLGHNLAFL